MKILIPVLVLAFSSTLASCSLFEGGSENTSGMAGGSSGYEELIGKAETAYKDLDSMGGAWSFMEDDLQEAKTAASKKEMDKAVKLAKKVISDVETALKQANEQKNAGPHLF